MSLPVSCGPCSSSSHLPRRQLPLASPRSQPQVNIRQPSQSHRATCRATPVATEELEGEDLQQWHACQGKVEELGFSPEEAVKFLNKAFAWQKGYWGPEKPKPEAPSTSQIDAVIAYMEELGVKDKDLAAAVKQFPQLLGMKVEERMKPNITKIEHEFKIQGPAMKNVLKRKPQVLGFNWDCYGQRFTRNMIAELTKAILAIQEIDGTHQQVASVPALTPAIDSYLSKPVVCSNTSKWVELYVPGDCLIVISNSTA